MKITREKYDAMWQVCEQAKYLREHLGGLGAMMTIVGLDRSHKNTNDLLRLFGQLWEISSREKDLSRALEEYAEILEAPDEGD